ncbi:MAG: molybdopterin-dependent oxidoreductase, partial [Thermohalobaculum sp.]|nr:molybdopterin-dependent oxidoreductase [Thermohalobaculum sp.]
GPLVETHMTRCISCTRCVRFMTEVAGVPEMGQIGRGEDSEITSYDSATLQTGPDLVVATLHAGLSSELQGNIVDLCPVGALTNKPYAFTARPWELRKFPSIDVMDALGSNIRVDVRGREVMRFLPRNHDGVNEEWLADRSRYVWDGLRRQRLDRPYVRRDGKLKPATWADAFAAIAATVKAADGAVASVAGDLVSVEPMWALKTLMAALGSDRHDCRQDGARLIPGNRSAYVGNATVADIDAAGAVLILGSNPRDEAPVLNARIRKAWINGADVAVIGAAVDLTFPTAHLGTGPEALTGKGRAKVVELLKAKPSPLIIVGQGALARDDGAAVIGHAMALAAETGAKLMVLHTAAARVGAMDIGFTHPGGVAGALEGAKVVFNLGADEIDIAAGPVVVYQGHHGDRGAHRADVILPGAAWTEQPGTYVNTDGRVQIANRAGFPPGDAREDWAILRALSAELGATLPFDTLDALRRNLYAAHPHLAAVDRIAESPWQPVEAGALAPRPFRAAVADHYLTNAVARASAVMAECSRLVAERRAKAMAAE